MSVGGVTPAYERADGLGDDAERLDLPVARLNPAHKAQNLIGGGASTPRQVLYVNIHRLYRRWTVQRAEDRQRELGCHQSGC
jgi:hypothetical protein